MNVVSSYPVDVVYTWVDGNDPLWAERNRAHLIAQGILRPACSQRFACRDELRYSLRSVARYMPWVNRIFIVTDRQCPAWLNVNHPRVRIVDHSEIFDSKALLPSFNSVAIESHLHRIPGLAERYVYFNDDMLLGRPFLPEDFHTADGLPRKVLFQYGRTRLYSELVKRLPDCYRHLQMLHLCYWMHANADNKPPFIVKQHYNRMVLIKRLHKALPYFRTRHTPIPFTRTEALALETLFWPDYEVCRSHRFRAKNDLFIPELSATASLLEGMAEGRYYDLDDLFFHKLGIAGAPDFSLLCEGSHRFIGINDDSGACSGREIEAYRAAMDRLYPQPCEFEVQPPSRTLYAKDGASALNAPSLSEIGAR